MAGTGGSVKGRTANVVLIIDPNTGNTKQCLDALFVTFIGGGEQGCTAIRALLIDPNTGNGQ